MKKSILIICPRYDSVQRGVEVFTRELSSRLDKDRYSVTVLSHLHSGSPIEGVRFVRRPTLPRERAGLLYRLPFVSKLLAYVRCSDPTALESFLLMFSSAMFLATERFDLVLPFGGPWTYFFASRLCRGAKIVSVGHAGPSRYELSKSDAFVAITQFAIQEASTLGVPIPMKQIPNGVDAARFAAPEKPQGNRKVVLCVAALAKPKRHELLFAATSLLSADVIVRCVGAGPEKARFLRHPLAKAGRLEFVEAAHDEMPQVYRQADVVTLPCPDEPFGLAMLEGLAAGLNVVTHDGPRQRYVLGDVGFYCNVFNATEYAKALRLALSTRQRERNIERARQFDWKGVIDSYDGVFQELLR